MLQAQDQIQNANRDGANETGRDTILCHVQASDDPDVHPGQTRPEQELMIELHRHRKAKRFELRRAVSNDRRDLRQAEHQQH
jgi:hypothetical protein